MGRPLGLPVPDILGVHREKEDGALLVGLVEFRPPDFQHVPGLDMGSDATEAGEPEVGVVVQHPINREFHHARGSSVLQKFIRPVMGHETAVVEESQLPDEFEGGTAEVPGRCLGTHWPRPCMSTNEG